MILLLIRNGKVSIHIGRATIIYILNNDMKRSNNKIPPLLDKFRRDWDNLQEFRDLAQSREI